MSKRVNCAIYNCTITNKRVNCAILCISCVVLGLYEASGLVTEVLKELYNNEQACQLCLCQDDIITTLLSPISQFLDDTTVSQE